MKILNFGSLNIDYVYSVEHFVRAGETISSTELELFAGGKGLNQSVAFSRAGAETYHAGCIGSEGKFLVDMLRKSGVNTDFVRCLNDTSSGHAIIQVNSSGENCIMLYGGANKKITDSFMDEVFSNFGDGDLLMLQNEVNDLNKMIRKAKSRKMKVALNPSPFNDVITSLDLSLVDYIILNETEGQELTKSSEANEIIDVLTNKYPHMTVILTLGSRGSVYAYKDIRIKQDIFKTTVVDTTAAGDTFTGYFFASLTSGKTPGVALKIASAASSITVSRKGAAPSIPTMDELTASKALAINK